MKGWNAILLTLTLTTTISINYLPRNIYYFEANEEGIETLTGFKMFVDGEQLIEDRIVAALMELFRNEENKLTLIPEGVEVNFILFMHGELELELSKDILNYGGTMWEEGLIDQLLATVFSFEEVDKVTIKIAENRSFFVEGTEINGYTRGEWNERKCQIWPE